MCIMCILCVCVCVCVCLYKSLCGKVAMSEYVHVCSVFIWVGVCVWLGVCTSGVLD